LDFDEDDDFADDPMFAYEAQNYKIPEHVRLAMQQNGNVNAI